MVTGFLEDIFRKYSGIFHSLMDVKGDLNVITVKFSYMKIIVIFPYSARNYAFLISLKTRISTRQYCGHYFTTSEENGYYM